MLHYSKNEKLASDRQFGPIHNLQKNMKCCEYRPRITPVPLALLSNNKFRRKRFDAKHANLLQKCKKMTKRAQK